MRLAERLADSPELAGRPIDRESMLIAAMFHDAGREVDTENHCDAGSEFVMKELATILDAEQLEKVAEMVRHHNRPVSAETEIIHDADLIDRIGTNFVWRNLYHAATHKQTLRQAWEWYQGVKDEWQSKYVNWAIFEITKKEIRRRADIMDAFYEEALRELECDLGAGAAYMQENQMTKQELGKAILKAAYLEGDFVLRSGKRSKYYLDKYLFGTKPQILSAIADEMAKVLPKATQRIGGTVLGAVTLATALSLKTGIPAIIARKTEKDYGTAKLVEGEWKPGEKVVLVEDVVTTGGAALEAAENLKKMGLEVLGVIAVIDREEGGKEAFAAKGINFQSLFTKTSLGI
jgi:orotate phosphoribosyltransferase